MRNARLPRFSAICDRIIEGFIIFLIVFTPLAFGTVNTWSITIMECVAFMALATWLVKMTHEKELIFCRLWLHIPLAVLLYLMLLQLLPLPPQVLGFISPETFRTYQETIPDWPQRPPFETIEKISSELGVYIPTHERLSSNRSISIYTFATQSELLKYLTYLSIFYIIINNFKDRITLERLTTIIILMGFLLAVFGLVQHFSWNGKIYWLKELKHGGAPFGPFVNRNHFAGYMEMVIPLALGSLVARTLHIDFPHKGLSPKDKVLAFFGRETAIVILLYSAVVIMMFSLFFSISRGGILSLLVGIIIFAVLMPKKRRLTPIFAILGVIFVIGALQEFVVKRFLEISDVGFSHRYDFWKDSVGIIKDFPIFGTGLGDFPWVFTRYQSLRPEAFVRHAHNDYIEFMVDMGLLGLFAVIAACVLYFLYVTAVLNRRKSTYTRAMVCGGIASLGAVLTHSAVDFNLHISSNALLATLIAALTLGLVTAYEKNYEPKTLLRFWELPLERRWSVITSFVLTGLFLIFLLSIPIRNGLAEAYYRLREQYQNPSTKIALTRKASELQSSNSKYYRELSKFYILAGERGTALPFLMKAIYLKPTDAYLHLQMAALLDTFVSLREVPPGYGPWERAIGQQLKASMALFPIDPTVHAGVCNLILKRWGYLNETQRQTVLSILSKTLELDSGKHSEAILEALWETSGDMSLVKDVIRKSGKQNKHLSLIVERLENSDKNTDGTRAD